MRADQTALPKYIQVSEFLIREIAAGRIKDGARLPPERDMSKELDVAVGTLRKALNELEQKGLLERIHGSGNYVRHSPEASGLYAFFRLELPGGGGLPTAQVLDVAKLNRPADLPDFGQSTSVHRIRRTRALSEKTVAVEEIWLDGKWANSLRPDRLSESLYLYYRRSLDLWIAKAEDRVGVSTVPEWAHDLAIFESDAVGFVERFGETVEGEIAEYSRTWFEPKHARYISRMK